MDEREQSFIKEDPKFDVDDHVRIPKYKNIFLEGYKRWLVIKKGKKYCAAYMLLKMLMVKKWLKDFTRKYCKTQIKNVKSCNRNQKKRWLNIC